MSVFDDYKGYKIPNPEPTGNAGQAWSDNFRRAGDNDEIHDAAIAALQAMGVSGYSGVSGFSGFSGYSGKSGFSGVSGFSGYSGVGGLSGFSGYSGVIGTSGFSGYSGTAGNTGASGFSGYSGTSGFSGYSGTSGFSGKSGFSGYSGAAASNLVTSVAGKQGVVTLASADITDATASDTPNTLVKRDGNGDVAVNVLSLDAELTFNGSAAINTTGTLFVQDSVTGPGDVRVGTISFYDSPASTSVPIGVADGVMDLQGLTLDNVGAINSDISVQQVDVAHNGTLVNPRRKINFVDGTNVTLTVADNPGANRVDVTIASSGGGGGGTSGYSGVSGFSGVSGYSGVSGFSGFSGYSGKSGFSGVSGFSGYSGVGTSGFSGYSGVGTSGFSGYSGATATSGFSGYSGVSGFSGYSGVGTSGFSGYSGVGTSGFSGYSGATATSGFSGYSGKSGYSGVSGYSGASVAGSDTQVQFNDGGAFGGDAGFVYNKTTDTATIGSLRTTAKLSADTTAVAYAATVTPNVDNYVKLNIGAMTGGLTVANYSGTPVDGQTLRIRTLQDGTGGRATSWGTNYITTTPGLATVVTTLSTYTYYLFEYNSTLTKFVLLSIVTGVS